MSRQLFKNNAASTLSGTLAVSATTLNLASGGGAQFPALSAGEYAYLTLYEKDSGGVEIRYEIVKVTAISGDILTIVRDIEGLVVAAGGTSGGWDYPSAGGVNPTGVVHVEMRFTAFAAGNALTKDDNLTGLASTATARTNLGLGNVDNTADSAKPVSTAQATADTAIGTAAATDATTKANAAAAASAPVAHVGSGGTAHANAVAAGAAGFMTGADKTKLDAISGTNTGDQTTITGNAATATALQTARTIGGVSFNGTANTTVASATGGFAVTGALTATGNVTAYYSDIRLKDVIGPIPDPLGTLRRLRGFLFRGNALASSFGFDTTQVQSGVSAQAFLLNVPGSTAPAPFDRIIDEQNVDHGSKSGEEYLTADYAKAVPVLLEVCNALLDRIEALEGLCQPT